MGGLAGSGFLYELRRRHVVRVAVAYVALAWVLLQLASIVFPVFGAPEWVLKIVIALLVLAFPVALFLAWAFEMTPEGIRRTEPAHSPDARPQEVTHRVGRQLNTVIISVLALMVAVLLADRVYFHKATSGAAPVATPEKSIAVLPFANTSGDPANEYFSDGMSEELINTLGRLKDLTVIGRSSSFQFKGKGEAATAIGTKLGVAYLLEGSVRKAEDKVRIAVELVRTENGANVWSETYDRELKDIFAVQSEIASQVARKLESTLLAGSETARELKPDAPPSGSVEAYNAVLQGNFYSGRRTADDLQHAVELYRQAARLDPRYALALARLVYTRAELDVSFIPAVGDARKALRKEMQEDLASAERVDPRSPEVPLARGYVMEVFDLDVAGATVEYNKSAELAPQNPTTAFRLAAGQGYIGEYQASIDSFRHMLTLDPLSARGNLYLSIVLSRSGRLAEAEAALRKAIELQPQAAVQHAYLAHVHVLQGRGAEAVAAAQAETDEFWRNWALAFSQWANGDRAASDLALQWLIEHDKDDAGSQIAQIYSQRGQEDEVFRWLEHALETNDGGLTQMRVAPFLSKYEQDPRYQAIARKVRVWPG